MRPVRRNASPLATDFANYEDAKPYLVSRLGAYCSYCERPILAMLAVEHIQPKGLTSYSHLRGNWKNFLLACPNCNSIKKDRDVVLSDLVLPDRDNSAMAYTYLPDGTVRSSLEALAHGIDVLAKATLKLTGLDRQPSPSFDENQNEVALERIAQRKQAWKLADISKTDLSQQPGNNLLKQSIVRTATNTGFFSVWMTVFEGDSDMRQRLIDAFPGTRQSGCFHLVTGDLVTPAPNYDTLTSGSKI